MMATPEGETSDQYAARMYLMAAARMTGVKPESLVAAAAKGEPMQQLDGETFASFNARIRKLAAASTAPAVSTSTHTRHAAQPTASSTLSGIDESSPAVKELQAIQQRQRANGWTRTVGARWVQKSTLRTPNFRDVCAAEFASDPELRAKHADWASYTVARHMQLQAEAKRRNEPDETGLPRWMSQARKEYAGSETLRLAFRSERDYLLHLMAEQDN